MPLSPRSVARRLVLVPAVALLAAAATGCTDKAGEPLPSSTTVASGDPVDGGVVRLGLAGPVVADPTQANPASPSDLMVLDLLHDGLVHVDADGELQPQVAASWRPNHNLTAWLFELSPTAAFSDGRAITNADVVASLEHVISGGQSSLPALRLEAVTGFTAFVTGKADHVAGITARPDGTVHIALDRPMSTLPTVLAAPEMGIVAVAALDELAGDDTLANVPLSGSWEVAAADDGVVALGRREDRGGHLNGVELRSFADGDAAYAAFEEGDVDWALVPGERHDDAVDDYGDAHFAPFHAEVFFGLRVARPPLGAQGLRTAIVQAIDRESIVEEVYDDRADPLATVVPAGLPGDEPVSCEVCAYDPDAARETLEKAFPDGKVPVVHLDFDASDTQRELAELVAADLEDVGIPTELREKPLDEYRRFVVTGGQELFSFGWIGGYASPDAYLAPLFGSAADDNLTGVADDKIDAALASARSAREAAAAERKWAEAEARALSLALVVPIAQFRTQPVVAPEVQGLAHAVDGTVDWAAVWRTDGAD